MREKLLKSIENNYGQYLLIIAVWLLLICGTFSAKAQTYTEVYRACVELDIKHPEIVTSQFILETGWGKSGLCKLNNNLFGMKLAKQRFTTAKGSRHKHAWYSSWYDSVIDYYIWQRHYYKHEDYFEFLQSIGYAESKDYINKLKEIIL